MMLRGFLFFLIFGAIGAANAADLHIVNATDKLVLELYIAPNGSSEWGADRLQGRRLAQGQSITIGDIDPARYRVRIQTSGVTECDSAPFNLADSGYRLELKNATLTCTSTH